MIKNVYLPFSDKGENSVGLLFTETYIEHVINKQNQFKI